jgi:hypothetical protein
MNIVPKCCKNNDAVFVCVNKNCNSFNPFICDICDRNNDCKLAHKKCVKYDWI